MLAFAERNFGLPPLNANDAAAYDYRGSFDYSQAPLARVQMVHTRIPAAERKYLARHPADESDPT